MKRKFAGTGFSFLQVVSLIGLRKAVKLGLAWWWRKGRSE